MIKVLLADDEKKVCQLITHLVDWKAMGFEIVGIVNDGESAYQFVRGHEVDVMLTDIRMPGCDGMELIQKTKALYPNIHFVIISGYSQFDYAQNAIRYGVEDYLLKPIRKKDLTATLLKIVEKYKAELKDEAKWETMQKSLQKNVEKLKGNLLRDLLNRPEEFAGVITKEKVNQEYHYDFIEGCYQTVIIKPILSAQDIGSRKMLLEKALGILRQKTGDICHEIACAVIHEDIYCIFNGSEEEIEEALRKLKRVKLDIIRLQDVFEQVTVHIALGERKECFSEVLEGFQSARDAMYGRFYSDGQSFLTYKKDCNSEEQLTKMINNAFKKHFLSYIEIMDLDSINAEFERIKEQLKTCEGQDGHIVIDVYKEILTLFYFGVHNYNISIENKYTELLVELDTIGTIDEVMETLRVYIIGALDMWFKQKQFVESRPIRAAKQYIAQNYYKALTLEMVSREIGFNPTYFSSMFKKETNMNFSEYLVNVRIENAKNLLLNSDEAIVDIAEIVGYSDIKYFSKLFKKTTGLTPTEFRKLYN